MFNSPLRYPGGKTFLTPELNRILDIIGLRKPMYIEPYAGGAGAALNLLFADRVSKIIINDYDPAIFSFWKSVVNEPERFARKVISTPITIKEWEKQKLIYLDENANSFERGFATFFLNRTNRSGVMNSGPIGGMKQNGTYKINARYNKKDLAERIKKIGKLKNRIEVCHEEGIELTKKYLKRKNVFIYLDPPYFKQGAMLYLRHYKEQDHKNLAELLNNNADKNWILTYDDKVKIKNFYPKRAKKRLLLNYRIQASRKARELMIYSDTTKV
jgi:DNA adenine methylase